MGSPPAEPRLESILKTVNFLRISIAGQHNEPFSFE